MANTPLSVEGTARCRASRIADLRKVIGGRDRDDSAALGPSQSAEVDRHTRIVTAVDVQCFRQTGNGPRFGDLAFPQRGRFVDDGVQQAQIDRNDSCGTDYWL